MMHQREKGCGIWYTKGDTTELWYTLHEGRVIRFSNVNTVFHISVYTIIYCLRDLEGAPPDFGGEFPQTLEGSSPRLEE